MASPDINTEDFQAAVDFLSVQENVDPERIGIIGICGWGGLALNAAALDTRIKAAAASTMYDMARVNANGYFQTGMIMLNVQKSVQPLSLCMYSATENGWKERHVCSTRTCSGSSQM